MPALPSEWPPVPPGDTDAPRPREAHVWRIATDLGEQRWRKLEDMLPPADQRRARAMADPRARRRHVVTRAALRAVVAGYLGEAFRSIPLQTGPHGKPDLPPDWPLRINASHAGRWALVAAARPESPAGAGIGVDLEEVRPRPISDRLLARRFAPAERRVLAGLPEPDRLHVFYMLWCRKEACLKATGGGLSARLDALDLSASPDETARVQPPWTANPLFVTGLDPAPGCAGALAAPFPVAHLRCFTLPADTLLTHPLGT